MFAEEFIVVDGGSQLWSAGRSILQIALRLDQDADLKWHGWQKASIEHFLKQLPSPCSLIVGVWETAEEPERLILGMVCEVSEGEVHSIRTLEALVEHGLKPPQSLEPGIDDALEILRVVKHQIAPAAWALFTDKTAWDEWLLTEPQGDLTASKDELLASLARQGRCVLLGSQVTHQH